MAEALSEFVPDLDEVIAGVRNLLIEKNRKYGNAALDPVGVFSKADAIECIKIRLDDKLARMRSHQSDEDEDVELDTLGYLLLLRIARLRAGRRALQAERLAQLGFGK